MKKEGSPWEGSAGTEIIAKYEFCQLDSRLRLTATDAETKDLEDVRSYWKETWSPFNSRDIVEQRAGRYREIRWQAYNIKSINRIVDLRTIGVEWVIYIILFPQPDLCDLPPKKWKRSRYKTHYLKVAGIVPNMAFDPNFMHNLDGCDILGARSKQAITGSIFNRQD